LYYDNDTPSVTADGTTVEKSTNDAKITVTISENGSYINSVLYGASFSSITSSGTIDSKSSSQVVATLSTQWGNTFYFKIKDLAGNVSTITKCTVSGSNPDYVYTMTYNASSSKIGISSIPIIGGIIESLGKQSRQTSARYSTAREDDNPVTSNPESSPSERDVHNRIENKHEMAPPSVPLRVDQAMLDRRSFWTTPGSGTPVTTAGKATRTETVPAKASTAPVQAPEAPRVVTREDPATDAPVRTATAPLPTRLTEALTTSIPGVPQPTPQRTPAPGSTMPDLWIVQAGWKGKEEETEKPEEE
jgi:hypothetical protein